jgi:hypothetical protein
MCKGYENKGINYSSILIQYLLSKYYMPDTTQDVRNTSVNKTEKVPFVYILLSSSGRRGINKEISNYKYMCVCT